MLFFVLFLTFFFKDQKKSQAFYGDDVETKVVLAFFLHEFFAFFQTKEQAVVPNGCMTRTYKHTLTHVRAHNPSRYGVCVVRFGPKTVF